MRGTVHSRQPSASLVALLATAALVVCAPAARAQFAPRWDDSPSMAEQLGRDDGEGDEERPVPQARPLAPDELMPELAGLIPLDYDEGQVPELAGQLVVEVRIRGLRHIDKETVLGRIKVMRDKPLDTALVSEDVRALYQSGFFRDVAALVRPAEGGLTLVYHVVENPTIRKLRFEGNDDLSNETLKELVDIKTYKVLNKSDLARNTGKIKDKYVDEGHYLADVSYRLEEVAEGTMVDVIFVLDERQKIQIHSINFVGNRAFSAAELKAAMQTREGGLLGKVMGGGTFKDEHLQMDVLRLQALYFDHGYIKVKVAAPEVTISNDLTNLFITIPIDEGPRYTIGQISFAGDTQLAGEDGSTDITPERLRKLLTIASGETFVRSKLFADIQRITTLYQDRGYAYCNVIPDSRPRSDLSVDLSLQIEKGQKVYFGRIEIVGHTITRDKVIRRELRIYEGDLYSATGMARSKARAYQLGFFETVELTTSPSAEPNVVDVTVKVKEKPSGAFQLGAGYSSLEGFVATGQVTQNNWLGRGQYLGFMAQLSFGSYGRKLATLQFSEPYFMDTLWSMSGRAYLTQELYREFQRNSQGVSPGFGYWLTEDLRLSLGYTLEWIEITTDTLYGTLNRVLNNLNQEGRSSALSLTLSYDTRDNRLFPTAGQYHVASAEAAGAYLGSELDFKRLILNGRVYWPIVWQLVLSLQARIGYITSADPNGVPIAERFFPGGIYTLRGFEYRSLGPRINIPNLGTDPFSPQTPFAIGGNKQALFNVELEFPILPAAGLKGVLFADGGNAYGEAENFFYLGQPEDERPRAFVIGSGRQIAPPFGMYYSVGFGFRWYSPIGLLRFEWGVPLTKPNADDRSIQFEFTIGAF